MENFPQRKPLRLKDYDYARNGCYYVTICTYERQRLFPIRAPLRDCREKMCDSANTPDKTVEKWLMELENKFCNVKICEYVVMPDHVHFIVSITGNDPITGAHIGAPLPDIVGWFKTMTTNEYIRCVKKGIFPPFNKKIWQRGYYDHIIRDEADYLRIVEYILNNPLNWELSANP